VKFGSFDRAVGIFAESLSPAFPGLFRVIHKPFIFRLFLLDFNRQFPKFQSGVGKSGEYGVDFPQ
jgi:hypothetical protein